MKKILSLAVLFLILFSQWGVTEEATQAAGQKLAWQDWTLDLFEKAQAEKKFVILDLEAVWCHWCHVMEETTYQDPRVVELIQSKYIPVRVDQDAHPDLSFRYEQYGWPATIIFDSEGKEIVKRRGYIQPDRMASLLQAIIEDPSPEEGSLLDESVTVSETSFLRPEQSQQLIDEHYEFYDTENAGWGNFHKLIDADNLEYAVSKAQSGDQKERAMATATLDQALHLLDPVWGGFYQYSDEVDWKSPHYEKIMQIQADYLRLYAFAYGTFKKENYLAAAKKTAGYIREFWTSADGTFYTSQDADISPEKTGAYFYKLSDAERRKETMPRIDKHIYARENGWMISALTHLYNVSGEKDFLNQAQQAAKGIGQKRKLEGGGFRHDEKDAAGPYLGETLAMARAFLNLYASTGTRDYLKQAEEAMQFIENNFKEKDAGYVNAASRRAAVGVFQKSIRHINENIELARFTNLLFHNTGNQDYWRMAEHAMRYLVSDDILGKKHFLTGILIADEELRRDPLHITVVGGKNDEQARQLYTAGLNYPAAYKRIEWWDRKEGALPRAEVKFPELPKAAAFACANGTCSLPIFDPTKLAPKLDSFLARQNDINH